MTVPRWLLALLVAGGLLAMHGITASSAAAATPCGVTAVGTGHASHGPKAPSVDLGPVLAAPAPAPGHDGAMCLAVLVGAALMALLARSTALVVASGRCDAHQAPAFGSERAPPRRLLSALCVSRT